MRVGILLSNYGFNAYTRRAIRIGEICRVLGHDVVLLVKNVAYSRVDPLWDGLVMRETQVFAWAEWARLQDSIVWVEAPVLERVLEARACNTQTICLFDWHRFAPLAGSQGEEALAAVDVLACPSHSAARLAAERYSQASMRDSPDESSLRVEYVGWSCNLPRTRPRRATLTPQMVVVHLPDGPGEILAYDVLESCLSLLPHSVVEVVYDRLVVSDKTQFRLHKLSRLRGNQLRLLPAARLSSVALASVLTRAALSIELATASTLAGFVWLSLQCGAPVLAYDVPPYSEYIRTGRNGLLTDCGLNYNGFGAPVASVNSTNLPGVLGAAVADWEALADRFDPYAGLERPEGAVDAWRAVLE